jgi:hypothetical protein
VKIKYVTVAIILAFTCTMVATGQRRTTRTQRAKPSASPAPLPTPATSTLSIAAGLIYESGDVKPVARNTFYLLDEDLRIILKPFDERPGSLSSVMDLLKAVIGNDSIEESYREKARVKYSGIKSAIESHIFAEITTDFSGKATLESLAPGTRFIYGEFRVGRERIAWNVKVELKAGANVSVILDNSNGSY